MLILKQISISLEKSCAFSQKNNISGGIKMNGFVKIHDPENVPACAMAPGMKERELLKEELERQKNNPVLIPAIVGGKEIYTDEARRILQGLKDAVNAAMDAKEKWERLPVEHRLAIFEKAADLIEGKYRYQITAALMLGQSKTAWEAECDSPDEVCDLLRYGVYYAHELYSRQPKKTEHVMNRLVYRPLEGFVCAITPFNFASIAANLPGAPAIMGNVVVWKPSTTAILSSWYIMKAFMEAGVPAGVINFIPSRGSDVSKYVLGDYRLGGFHFTGSTEVFKDAWKQIGENIHKYRYYPRMVGKTGGKDYIFAAKSADIDALVTALIRGAYDFSGQKCSAVSRSYIPASIWPQVKEKLLSEIAAIKIGDPCDFTNFAGAVIDKASFDRSAAVIDTIKKDEDA